MRSFLLGIRQKSRIILVVSRAFPVKAGDKTDNHTQRKWTLSSRIFRDLTDMQRLDLMLSDF